MLRFLTSGESHGPELNIILEGIPANMPLVAEDINQDLRRRQGGYGRGGRMKIEKDKVTFTGGVRHGRSFGGAPVAMKIVNLDHEKWLNVMSSGEVNVDDPEVKAQLEEKFISKVRPGHADFAGALKYNAPDVRDILERSSARETTSRVAAGAVCKKLLSLFNIEIFSHVLRIGEIKVSEDAHNWWHDLDWTDANGEYFKRKELIEKSEVRIYDPKGGLEDKIKAQIDEIRKAGDTAGGLIEVYALGVPVGLGSHVQWDRRLDGLIAQAMMSTHTVKSVEIGLGEKVAETLGSSVHDQIYIKSSGPFKPETKEDTAPAHLRYTRFTNNLGGTEGGMSNGLPIVAKVGAKPIPTLISKLDSVDLESQSEAESHFERSDICVVPAAGVVLEAMMAITIAKAFLDKFAGDSIEEVERNYQAYLEQCSQR